MQLPGKIQTAASRTVLVATCSVVVYADWNTCGSSSVIDHGPRLWPSGCIGSIQLICMMPSKVVLRRREGTCQRVFALVGDNTYAPSSVKWVHMHWTILQWEPTVWDNNRFGRVVSESTYIVQLEEKGVLFFPWQYQKKQIDWNSLHTLVGGTISEVAFHYVNSWP
jgi:hypothetical protein